MNNVSDFCLVTGDTIIAKHLSYRVDNNLSGFQVRLGTQVVQ